MSVLQDTAGPMARTVADIGVLLEACQGYDPTDPISAQQIGFAGKSYNDHLAKDGLNGKRIGMLLTNFGKDADILAAMENSKRIMREMGAQLVDIDISEFETSGLNRDYDVQIYESESLIDRYFVENNAPVSSLRELIKLGVADKYVQPLLEQCISIENPLEQPAYFHRKFKAQKLRELAFAVMAGNNLHAMCYPHQQILVEKIGTGSQAGRNGIFASTIGFPAITLPGGFSPPGKDAPLGIPIGLEFLGRPWNEHLLIEIAYSFEQASQFRKPPLSASRL
jgi:Asp-tRNA(Asn)/Glu-tRNA(Gln) amidotransferase A subunit family amidase